MEDSTRKILKANLLGGVACTCDGVNISLISAPNSKSSQLLLYLLYNYPAPQAKSNVLELLYGNSDADPVGSFKVLLLRLRRTMAQELGLSEKDCILLKNGMLSLSDSLEVRSDVQEFEALYQQSQQVYGEEKRKVLEKLCRIYRGELLPMLATEPWVIYGNAQMSEEYIRSVDTLCQIYLQAQEFESAYRCYKRGLAYFPYSEEWAIGAIEALVEGGKISQAQEEYEEIRSTLLDLFGMYPSERLLKAMEKIRVKMGSLKKPEVETKSVSLGAFYCTYPDFMSSYRILKRITEREQQKNVLLMLTIVDRNGNPLDAKGEITPSIANLHTAIGEALRKNDMYTRFSRNQMLVMLWNTTEEYVPLIMERITGRFAQEERSDLHRISGQVLDSPDPPRRAELADARAGEKRWVMKN